MFDNIWINLNIATMAGPTGFGIIKNAGLAAKDGKITWIGPMADLPGKPGALASVVRNGEDRWITPGLIDCHTHLVYGGDRARDFELRAGGASYADVAKAGGGILSTVKDTRAISEEDLYDSASARLRKLMKDGVTACEIKSGYGLDLLSETKLLRVATQLRDNLRIRVQRTFLGAHAVPPEFTGKTDAYVDFICNEMLPKLHAQNLVDCVDGFCENFAFSREQIEKVFRKAKELGLPVKLHAEQMSNQRGAELAAQYQALSADHLEYIDETGVKALAQAGSTAVLLPGSFYTLHEKQVPPVALFRKHGVPMAVATDHNPGSSPTFSLTLMAHMACTFFRLTPDEALAGITRNAARALGWQDDCGTLEKGKAANFVFWDINHPRDLCYYFGGNCAHGVVISGQSM